MSQEQNPEYSDFLSTIIDDGIDAAVQDYEPGSKRDGAVAGFNACRGKLPDELVRLWSSTNAAAQEKLGSDDELDQYLFLVHYASEVEWVLNCLGVGFSKYQNIKSYHT